MIVIGTAGYSYADWVGPFYPEGLPARDRLDFYAREFGMVEVNATYYRMPTPSFLDNMQKKTPADFTFIIKANRQLTHQLEKDEDGNLKPSFSPAGQKERQRSLFDEPEPVNDPVENFNRALDPLVEEKKLGGILIQFPYRFRNNGLHRAYLGYLAANLRGRLFVEFRHESWVQDAVYDYLRQLGMGLVGVDEPRLKGLVPPLSVLTADWGYVRFHGLNAEKWWKHDQAHERYDYLYESSELHPWAERIKKMAAEATGVYVSFNNHYQAQSIKNARMLAKILKEESQSKY